MNESRLQFLAFDVESRAKKKVLPHRYPLFLLLDYRVLSIKKTYPTLRVRLSCEQLL